MTDDTEFMTVAEAGRLFGLTLDEAYTAVVQRYLPTKKSPDEILVPTKQLHQLMAELLWANTGERAKFLKALNGEGHPQVVNAILKFHARIGKDPDFPCEYAIPFDDFVDRAARAEADSVGS